MTLIHDYALETELIAECDPFLFQYFKTYKKFSWDTGCLVVQYPSTWKNKVEKLVKDRRQLDILLAMLPRERIVRYADKWKDNLSWLENAEQENIRRPFYAILARKNPRNQPNVVCGAAITSSKIAWDQPPPSITVNRTAGSMAACIDPMLRYATRIRFIDPYFRASHKKYQNPLREFLCISCDSKPASKVKLELHASNKNELDWQEFLRQCEDELPRLIPRDFMLTVHLWKNREDKGQNFHNRYILTNIGGVQFGTGLDQRATKDTKDQDTITRLSILDTHKWISKYNYDKSEFDLVGKENIRGCRDIR